MTLINTVEKVIIEKIHDNTRKIVEDELKSLLAGQKDATTYNEKVIEGWPKDYRNHLRGAILIM
jgi:hypothetical protein